MKYVQIPEPILLTDLDGKPYATPTGPMLAKFDQFVRGRTLDPVFGQDFAGVIAAVEIGNVFKDCKPGAFVAVETEHWKRLDRATREPKNPYDMKVAVQMLPFMKAVIEAKDSLPAVVADPTPPSPN